MATRRRALAFDCLLGLTAGEAVASGDSVTHYPAKPSETLGEAVANFSKYNRLLADLIAKPELSETDLEHIHLLICTLEAALEKINAAMDPLPEKLERLRPASEDHDRSRVPALARSFLEIARTVSP